MRNIVDIKSQGCFYTHVCMIACTQEIIGYVALKMIDGWISCSMQMEAKVVLSKLFQSFTVSLPENYELVAASRTTTKPKDNVPCTLEVRKQ